MPFECAEPIRSLGDLERLLPSVYPAIRPVAEAVVRAWKSSLEDLPEAPPKVVVVGRFSSGKSCLLNSLVGAELLPVDTDASTAHRAHVEYGHEIAYHRVEPSGRSRTRLVRVSKHALTLVRHFKDRAFGETERPVVPHYRLTVPCALLRSVNLVDTPGYDDAIGRHWPEWATRVVLDACRDAEACMMVTNNTVGEVDLEVATSVKEICPRVFLVLNKSDLRSYEENLEMAEESASALESVLGVRPPVYCVSAAWAAADYAERLRMLRRPPLSFYGEPPLHQWEALREALHREGVAGIALRVLHRLVQLRGLHQALRILYEKYNPQAQAEHTFRRSFAEILSQVDDPLGLVPDIMSIVSAGASMPWLLLERVGCGIHDLAPALDIPSTVEYEVEQRYRESLEHLLTRSIHDIPDDLYPVIAREVTCFLDTVKSLSQARSLLHSAESWLRWRRSTAHPRMRYDLCFRELKELWHANPTRMGSDTAWILRGLTEWLESSDAKNLPSKPTYSPTLT